MRSTDVLITGKKALVLGFGDGQGKVQSLRGQQARVAITEVDLSARCKRMQGLDVVTLEDALETTDIFVTATGNKDIITAQTCRR